MTTIPDDVIEAMRKAIARETILDAGNSAIGRPPGILRIEGQPGQIVAALQAAEALDWKLVPRETTYEMHETGIVAFQKPENRHGAVLDETWAAMWDSAPKVKP
jgi:hypothetical protein